MIKAVLVINASGKVRLFQFYGEDVPIEARKLLIKTVSELIMKKCAVQSKCNFVDKKQLLQICKKHTVEQNALSTDQKSLKAFRRMLHDSYLAFRTYACLHFIMLVDEAENLLAIMDLIHLYVQLLEVKYMNVCEYDIVYDPQSAYYCLQELITDGLVCDIDLETLSKQMYQTQKQEIISDETHQSPRGLHY
mmetsp:Transcript_32480/g.52043  ORF Transcript_32480/g.52043 Transcript_32480/m.52043 type:complete len:192 (-) Transcript_32480:69-644(-)